MKSTEKKNLLAFLKLRLQELLENDKEEKDFLVAGIPRKEQIKNIKASIRKLKGSK